jgi:hypothetical protein
MRHPARKAILFAAISVFGGMLLWFGAQRHAMTGGDWTSVVPSAAGFVLAPVGVWFLIAALLHAIGRARLLAGHRRLAAWQLSADAWARFQGFDARRGASDVYRLYSELWPRRAVGGAAIDVIVGETSALIDESYHVLRPGGLPEMRAVRWLDNGAEAGRPPDCLEFELSYPRGRYGGSQLVSLRVPFPPSARAEALTVYRYFAERLERKSAIARRDPRNNPRFVAGFFAVGLLLAAVGWIMAEATGWSVNETLVPLVLLILGSIVAVFSAVVLLSLWLTARIARRYR